MATRQPKITSAQLHQTVTIARALGLRIAEVEVTPARVRLITEGARQLAGTNDESRLEGELARFRGQHGYGAS